MGMTDPIADMLTRIRNANKLGAEVVIMPSSKMKVGVAEALKREGFIDGFSVADSGSFKNLHLVLRY